MSKVIDETLTAIAIGAVLFALICEAISAHYGVMSFNINKVGPFDALTIIQYHLSGHSNIFATKELCGFTFYHAAAKWFFSVSVLSLLCLIAHRLKNK